AAGGAIHCLATHRLAVHVVPERATIPFVERLDEDDWIGVSSRLRPEMEFRDAFAPDSRLEGGLGLRGDTLGKADGEDARVACVEVHVADVRPEILAGQFMRPGEESARLLKRAHVRLHAKGDRPTHLLRFEVKASAALQR